MKLEKIDLDEDNRMLRCGYGKNNGLYFVRIDFWFFGIRLKFNWGNNGSIYKVLFNMYN